MTTPSQHTPQPADAAGPAPAGGHVPRGRGAAAPETQGDLARYRRLLRYMTPHLGWFVLAVLGFLAAAAGEAWFARLLGDIVDAYGGNAAGHAMLFPMLMLAAAATRAVGAVAGEFLMSRISHRVVHALRRELFEKLLTLPSAFFERAAQGALVSRLTYTTAQLRDTVTDAIKIVVADGGKVAVLLGMMIYANWRLTLIFLAVAPAVATIVRYASHRFRRISRRMQDSMGAVTHVASEAVAGHRVTRAFGGEAYERDRFVAASDRNRRQNVKMAAAKASSAQIIQLFVAAALAALVALLFRPEVAATMSAGDLVAYLGYAALLANPIKRLSEVNARLQRGLAAAEDVFWQLDQAPERDTGQRVVARARGHIEFRDVAFRHEGAARDTLKGVSFTVEPGQVLAVVGRSGAGKTTLAGLIARFHDHEDGEILLDGQPVASYRLANLRDQIALVPQQVTLFNDTLRRNIAYGRLGGSADADIAEAARCAHVDQFLADLPDGLDTRVGDDGARLSGGQRQRVAIARALLKDAPILILDEATSALDSESERAIQAALEAVMRGRTTIVIAHRLSTVERADAVLVLDKGRVVEMGRQDELLRAGGAFAQLYESQFADNGAEPGSPSVAVPLAPAPMPADEPVARRVGALERAWYAHRLWPLLLAPLAWLFAALARHRRRRFLRGRGKCWRAPVPVVVIGNVTVGGVGKTPLTIWLANWLQARGARVGVVSRGYLGAGRRLPKERYPLTVTAHTPASLAGDEAPLIAQRAGCPVVVGPDRVAAAKRLLADAPCDVLLSDDGLQHYALQRDVEVAVIDGARGLGNGRCLPAGPLREPASRLAEVDVVVANGAATGIVPGELTMAARAVAFRHLATGERVPAAQFAGRVDGPLHAVSGIGNPDRFHRTLSELGLSPIGRVFPDHHVFVPAELAAPPGAWVVVTEKDAAKLAEMRPKPNCWALQIEMVPSQELETALAAALARVGVPT